MPPWPVCLLLAAVFTLVFVAIRAALVPVMPDQPGFSILIPAILLAGLSGGLFTVSLTIILCLAAMWGLSEAFNLTPTVPGAFIAPALIFVLISATCGVVGASLRYCVRKLYRTHARLQASIAKEHSTSDELRAMINQVSSGIIRTTTDGIILEANEQFARMISRPMDQIIGHNVIGFTHPDDRALTTQRLSDYVTPGQNDWQFEKRYISPDGRTIHVLLDVRSLRHPDGTAYGFVCIVVDVTTARKTEAALSQSRHDFYSVADTIPVMMWLSDNDNINRFVNRAYFEFAGKPVDQVSTQEWKDLLHPDDYTTTVNQFVVGLKSRQAFQLQARYRRHDGKYRWVRSILQPRYDRDGVQKGIIGTAFDVTDAVEASTRIQESEARFRAIADSAPAIIWMVDTDGNTEFGNRRFRSTFGGNPPHHLISAIRGMMAPEDLPAFDQTLEDATREERRFSYLGPVHHTAFGTRWLHTEAAPRYDLQGRLAGFTGVSLDVTESQRAERELKRSNERLEERVSAALAEKAAAEAELVRAHRLEAVGRLTGGVAHDFNNLLTVIMGGLEIIRKTDDPARRQKMAEAALAAARRGERLTGQLLAFSRRQTLRPASIDLNALIREGEPLLHKAVGEGMSLQFKLKRGLAPTLVDAAKFEAALINLLVNARDASPSDAQICVETADYVVHPPAAPMLALNLPASDATPASAIHPSDLPPGRYVRVTVADNGSGMTDDVLKRVFEPFFTTKGVGHGTGLGLSQVYGFTRQSGGSISIQSSPDTGTRMNLFLPWHMFSPCPAEATPDTETEPRPVPDATTEAAADTAPKRLLMVEDDPGVAEVTATFLRTEGFDVDLARNATEALACLEDNHYEFLLSDILMPGGISGIELARRVETQWPDMHIILSSGFPGEVETLRLSAWTFLPKPYTPAQLRTLLAHKKDQTP